MQRKVDVYVVFTRHDSMGHCNSYELLKIFDSISPEVIFEELLACFLQSSICRAESHNIGIRYRQNVL